LLSGWRNWAKRLAYSGEAMVFCAPTGSWRITATLRGLITTKLMADTGGQKKKIDILLATYQRLALLKITVKAIKLRTKYPHRIIVVDNNSTDGTKEWLRKQHDRGIIDEVIFSDRNLGLGGAFQEGLRKVESEYFICTVDDVIPPKMNPCWLEQELIIAKENPEYGGIAMKGARISKLKNLGEDLKN